MPDSPHVEPTIQQLFNLSGKTSLVTGAGGHLGGAMARALAEAGSRLIVSSRDRKRARGIAESLPSPEGISHIGIELDYMDEASIERGAEQAIHEARQIDVLVNNGHDPLRNDWTDVTMEQFNRQLANASGYFHLSRLVRQHAVGRAAPASIILIGSMYGLVGSYPDAYQGIMPASPAAYHTLKGGIIHLTRHLAVYWASDQVRVNCLSPGPFPPPKIAAELVDRLNTRSPMARMGHPHELKGAIVYLASDASSYMTGQNLVIDGGWTAW